MHPKRLMVSGTIAVVISMGTALHTDHAIASPLLKSLSICVDKIKPDKASKLNEASMQDPLLSALGATSHEELYDAVYSGQSLATVAVNNKKDVQSIIDLQTNELAQQLQARYLSGSLSLEQYLVHQQELPELIRSSVHGERYS
ncbi:hypothetical protein J2Z69_003019 [Paenibacillus shirakamiensis]|uniref:Uncharacterized protein n=1 Tax=Paenibacillus shirakamiensis TaxID=1265935 RepID=A0ABS4JJV3_9BACL|nr:hypothetical protein [Paenibacillus shirakamiensis]MBP2001963.1 hypothetical protein [Paenibacillus shirakamiensis]